MRTLVEIQAELDKRIDRLLKSPPGDYTQVPYLVRLWAEEAEVRRQKRDEHPTETTKETGEAEIELASYEEAAGGDSGTGEDEGDSREDS